MGVYNRSFDICIGCALYEEAEAVLNEFSTRCSASFTEAFSSMDRYVYHHTTIRNKWGEPLTVLVTWPSDSGPTQTGLDLKPYLHEFRPRFVAMTGICAGYRKKLRLGDLVIAQYAYYYEEGKIIREPGRPSRHLPEMKTADPTSQIVQYARGFDGWKEPVREMKRLKLNRQLRATEEPRCVVAPMASGMAVRGDDPFPWLREQYDRNTVALDMEAATFYCALRALSHIHGLVVKGVCDYADMRRNDAYHDYAARASAVYLLSFIQEYVTEQTMPRRDEYRSPSPATSLSPFTAPYSQDPFFMGRENELGQLHNTLADTRSTAVGRPQAITGLGGVGKTQAAVEYAYRHRESYSAILWASADTTEALVASCMQLAETLQLPDWREQDQASIIAGVKRWLDDHTGWLLILDNIEDLGLVEKFVPVTRQGAVLLTTQREETEPVAHAIPLSDRLSEEESVGFLLKRAGCLASGGTIADASPDETTNALTIVHLLEGLLLALDQAGAYIRELKCGLQGYIERYQQQPGRLLNWKGRVPTGHQGSVMTTFSLAFEQVRRRSPVAAEVLKLCAFLAPEAIPEELIVIGTAHLDLGAQPMAIDSIALDEAIGTLLTFSLVKRDPHSKAVSIHRLVQAVLQDTMTERERRRWVEQAVNVVLGNAETKPSLRPAGLRAWSHHRERYLPHLRVCAKRVDDRHVVSSEVAELLDRFAFELSFSLEAYNVDEIIDALHKASKMWEEILGPDDLHIADCLTGLIPHYLWLGRRKEVEELVRRISDIKRRTDPEVLNAFPFRIRTMNALNSPDQLTS